MAGSPARRISNATLIDPTRSRATWSPRVPAMPWSESPRSAATGPAGGAWSLTGPYGSGKSSLALLLDAALGGPSRARDIVWRLIDEASPAVADLVRQAHRRHRTRAAGFHRGLVTAGREPLSHTLLRALHTAVLRTYGEIPPTGRFRAADLLEAALEDANTTDPRRTGPSPASLIEIARCLAEDAPLLLIIDEFGKNLEAIRDGDDSDPYLFQQLAEAGQGSGLPIFLLDAAAPLIRGLSLSRRWRAAQ